MARSDEDAQPGLVDEDGSVEPGCIECVYSWNSRTRSTVLGFGVTHAENFRYLYEMKRMCRAPGSSTRARRRQQKEL